MLASFQGLPKRKSDKKQGRPGKIYHMMWHKADIQQIHEPVSEFVTHEVEYSQSRKAWEQDYSGMPAILHYGKPIA